MLNRNSFHEAPAILARTPYDLDARRSPVPVYNGANVSLAPDPLIDSLRRLLPFSRARRGVVGALAFGFREFQRSPFRERTGTIDNGIEGPVVTGLDCGRPIFR